MKGTSAPDCHRVFSNSGMESGTFFRFMAWSDLDNFECIYDYDNDN